MYNYVDYDSMKRYKRISRLLIVLGVIALIIFNNSIFEIFIGMSILGVAGYFQWKYEDQYKDQILLPVIRSIFPNSNFEISYSDPILTDSFYRVGMIYKDEKELLSNYLTIENGDNTLIHFTCEEYNTSGDSTTTTYLGTEISYNYSTNIEGVVRVISSRKSKLTKTERTFISEDCQLTPAKIDTGELDFDENFEVCASNEHLGFYVLNSVVIEKLKAFRDKYGEFGIAITCDNLYLSFPGKDRFIKIPRKTSEINESMFSHAQEEIQILIQMLNDIGYAISKHSDKEMIFKG